MFDKELFDNRLLYIGINEFVAKRIQIKELLKLKSPKDHYLYKLWVYSRPFMSDSTKDVIWDYLNDYMNEFDFAHWWRLYREKLK